MSINSKKGEFPYGDEEKEFNVVDIIPAKIEPAASDIWKMKRKNKDVF